MRPGRIELYIEEMVLRGFPPEARHRIGDAVERELARIIAGRDAEGSSAPDGGRIPHVDAGACPADLRAEEVGARIARTVHERIYAPRQGDL